MRRVDLLIDSLSKERQRMEGERYKALIITGENYIELFQLAEEFIKREKIAGINILEELLPSIEKPTLGSYGVSEFAIYLNKMIDNEKDCICIYKIEPLLSTFGEKGAIAFFERMTALESKHPVVIFSYLSELVDRAGFPGDRVLKIPL